MGDLSFVKMQYKDFLKLQKSLKLEENEKERSDIEDETDELFDILDSQQDEIIGCALYLIPIKSYYGSYVQHNFGEVIIL